MPPRLCAATTHHARADEATCDVTAGPLGHACATEATLATQRSFPSGAPEPLDPRSHYDHDPIGAACDLAGAGPLALITGDHLHPPMVDDEAMWSEGRWRPGAIQHTLNAAAFCGLRAGERVLDIGCGVGGPARTLVDSFNVHVFGVSTSRIQLDTTARINGSRPAWSERIEVALHDCEHPYPRSGFDLAWSMNMLYHVKAKNAMVAAARDALRRGGRLMIDDWVLTRRATDRDREMLAQHFVSPHFAMREDLVSTVADAGFSVVRIEELGHIGRTHLYTHFRPVFDRKFRKLIAGCDPIYGPQMAGDFCAGIEHTIALYRNERMSYFRLMAVKI